MKDFMKIQNENVENTRRDIRIDYVKGFAIMLLIFSHCSTKQSLFKIWIFSFHMPIFFMICGMLTSIKNAKSNSKMIFSQYLLKRCKQLLIPYYFWCTILVLFYQVLNLISNNDFTIKSQFFNLITFQGIDSLWFIPAYFIAELCFIYIYLKLPKYIRAIGCICSITFLYILNITGMPEEWFWRLCCKVLIGLTFIYIGYIIEEKFSFKKISYVYGILGLFIFSTLALFNGFVGIGALQLQNVWLFFINAIGLSSSIIILFQKIGKVNINSLNLLRIFGENSIVILCTNNLIIEIIRLLDFKIANNILINMEEFGTFIFSIIVILIELIIIQLSREKLSMVFGK